MYVRAVVYIRGKTNKLSHTHYACAHTRTHIRQRDERHGVKVTDGVYLLHTLDLSSSLYASCSPRLSTHLPRQLLWIQCRQKDVQ
jgi:hypothetical protein